MRPILRCALFVTGLALLLLGLLAPAASTTSLAQGVPPRPSLTPAPRPTSAAGPTATPGRSDSPHATATPLGRITGTVIDLTTGAPVPGIAVQVGDLVVETDKNGNYDRSGLAAGNYDVQLRLTAGQGEPAQGVITVALAAGATVVQHLALRSAPAEAAPPAPTASAADSSAAPTNTTSSPAPEAAPPPSQLPQTGGRDDHPELLMVLGMALITAGLSLRRRQS